MPNQYTLSLSICLKYFSFSWKRPFFDIRYIGAEEFPVKGKDLTLGV